MLTIYCKKISNRLRYISNYLVSDLLGIPISLTDNVVEFESLKGAKLHYGTDVQTSKCFLFSHSLLFENGISEQDLKIKEIGNDQFLFFQNHPKSILDFDPFAGAFYILSRYEEYLPFEADEHGRFLADQSILFKINALKTPYIQKLASLLYLEINKYYPELKANLPPFEFIPSFDIDIAWAYKSKGFLRNTYATLKDFAQFKFSKIGERLSVLLQKKPDPFDTYSFIKEKHLEKGLDPIIFFHLGVYDRFDKNVSPNSKEFRKLVTALNATFKTGIHPSYRSHSSKQAFLKEIALFKELCSPTVFRSRQHYLKFHLPKTYQGLIEHGVTEEYSMGFAETIGFRAGTAVPFFWFDLENDQETKLKIFPFQFMDVTLQSYLNLNEKESLTAIADLVKEIKQYGGVCMSIWHNNTLAETEEWTKLRELYIKTLDLICS